MSRLGPANPMKPLQSPMEFCLDAFEDEEFEERLIRDVAFVCQGLELLQQGFRQTQ
jgi:hypothetical protein